MKVLLVGAFRTDTPNYLVHLREAFRSITQVWLHADAPKFTVLNRVLPGVITDEDYVLVCDDDITVPPGFLAEYMSHVRSFDLALAQPARTLDSSFHHEIVRQRPHSIARYTDFVEIGPLFSVRRDLFRTLFPFDEVSPMGWGYDYVWPHLVHRAGLRMGIVDATPVEHTLRPAISYDTDLVSQQMHNYMSKHTVKI